LFRGRPFPGGGRKLLRVLVAFDRRGALYALAFELLEVRLTVALEVLGTCLLCLRNGELLLFDAQLAFARRQCAFFPLLLGFLLVAGGVLDRVRLGFVQLTFADDVVIPDHRTGGSFDLALQAVDEACCQAVVVGHLAPRVVESVREGGWLPIT
jgi:hypothetical protein